MTTKDYLDVIVRQIHTVVVATVDENGDAITCAIDMMDCDDSGLYFLTARGKRFYDRLIRTGKLALTAVKGEDTLHSVSVSLRGFVTELGPGRVGELFEKNPYLKEIYPNEASRSVLTVFRLERGTGEWFDLSARPIQRESFSFGGAEARPEGFYVRKDQWCTGCGACLEVCPQKCIRMQDGVAHILQENCLYCGRCLEVCPADAIERR